MIEDSKELEQVAGMGRSIEINGRMLKASPLRLRDIITLSQYESDNHLLVEVRGYSVFLHLRENPNIKFEDVLDMEMADITKIVEFCDKAFYSDKKQEDDDSKNV